MFQPSVLMLPGNLSSCIPCWNEPTEVRGTPPTRLDRPTRVPASLIPCTKKYSKLAACGRSNEMNLPPGYVRKDDMSLQHLRSCLPYDRLRSQNERVFPMLLRTQLFRPPRIRGERRMHLSNCPSMPPSHH